MKKINTNDFFAKYGKEEIRVTNDFASNALSRNYSIVDAINELCDNSYDARIKGENLDIIITVDSDRHTLSIKDNGTGIVNTEKLLMLGGSDKKQRKDTIGKYGVGVIGAIATIASKCICDPQKMVTVKFESSNNGNHFEQYTGFAASGEQAIGKRVYTRCNKEEHFTYITFENIKLSDKQCVKICDSIDVTYELPLQKDLNISFIFNGEERVLGKSTVRTFVGDEKVETVKVGDLQVDVKYRIIGGVDAKSDTRKLLDAGLRFYDKESGRLLAMHTGYWRWFAGRQAQQTICGLRTAVFIDSSKVAYDMFGIAATKSFITYKEYYKETTFKELTVKLIEIYTKACGTKKPQNEDKITIGGYEYRFSKAKLNEQYKVDEDEKIVFINKDLASIAQITSENIKIKKKRKKKHKLVNA